MADYCTQSDLMELGYKLSDQDILLITTLTPRMSRMLDRACGLPENYFAAGDAANPASARIFHGDGTNHLIIDPYMAGTITDITMPTGYAAPTYQEKRTNNGEFHLIRTYGDGNQYGAVRSNAVTFGSAEFSGVDHAGWWEGVRVSVTAKWGWDATPLDVVEAVAEWVLLTIANRDQRFNVIVNIDTGQRTTARPQRTDEVIAGYKNSRLVFA